MSLICIDTGTTSSRVWLVENGEIQYGVAADVGVRDTARDGNNHRLRETLGNLLRQARDRATVPVTQIAAAGMITSALGLREVPHVAAPAGCCELSAGAVQYVDDELGDLPITLFPGVRSGPWGDPASIADTDIMRGEETLCLGLIAQRPGSLRTVINLGSHWKTILLNDLGQITSSHTTLSGELLHAIMTQTVLASAVPSGRPGSIDNAWCLQGAHAFASMGLSRMLFTVRLWELQASEVTPRQRLSYLIGGLVAEALTAVLRRALPGESVLIIGEGGIAQAWRLLLAESGIASEILPPEATSVAFVHGILTLLAATPS
ncbi:MAG: hypothetical protein DWH91_08705 [Planctomycetota bacterium]|nr:MAG: hypothetical protein DWH91_08705 [Planctomycetota bacterium]